MRVAFFAERRWGRVTEAGLALMMVWLVACPGRVWSQQEAEPAEVSQEAGRRCDLTWRPATDATVARIFRQTEEAQITYVSGGMVWTCGTATMEADSAVKYDLTRRVELIGNVRYRDTIRTLESEEMTYFEFLDRIVATGDVFLTRLSSGSTLEGPKVEFLRAVSGIDEVTLATGRPHMVLRPEDDPAADPFEVDADEAEFLGEEEARARGNVEILRPDLTAAADSAHFRLGDGRGVLFGEPWIEGEAFRLEGDTIRTEFEENELRSVLASGSGHATGESFEVVSEDILVGIEEEEVDAVWAYGAGRSLALSGGHEVYGDSLRFVMLEGRIDSVLSIREAAAVQMIAGATEPVTATSSPTGPSADLPVEGETGADTPVLAPDSLPAVRDTLTVAGDSAAAVPDTATIPRDTARVVADSAAILPDSLAATPDSVTGQQDAATVEVDSLAATQDTVGSTPVTDRVRAPRLTVDGTANWVTGDTLYATFERPVADSTASSSADSTAGASGSDTQAAADTSDAQIERLRVVGNARSFYAAIRDSTRTDRPSRSYLMGRTIEVLFENGEAQSVIGEDAIGLYLDPADFEDRAEGQPSTRPPRPEGMQRTPVFPSDSAPGETPDAPPDSTRSDSTSLSAVPARARGAAPSAGPAVASRVSLVTRRGSARKRRRAR